MKVIASNASLDDCMCVAMLLMDRGYGPAAFDLAARMSESLTAHRIATETLHEFPLTDRAYALAAERLHSQ